MKQLFLNNSLTWTKEAEEIVRETKVVLHNIMQKWIALGCSPREVSYIMLWSANDVELDTIIELAEKISPPKLDGQSVPLDTNKQQTT